jgi:hypothetical protein
MAIGLAQAVWSMQQYVNYPVHPDELQRSIWVEEQENRIRSALSPAKLRKIMPTS